jgi:N-acetylmuramoyl-L-alanine amidase
MSKTRPPFFLLLLAGLILSGAAPVFAGFSTVVLDAGHGGHDRGGIPGQTLSEKTFTLDITQRVAAILRARGLRVVMTRNGDYFVPLTVRTAIANSQRNAVFVSIHLNSGTRDGAHGYETYYFRGSESAALAHAIHRRLGTVSPYDNRGVKRRAYFVLRRSRIPAVLTESGFLTDPSEGRRLTKASYRQDVARAIAAGILDASRS